jgi:hypothetical protein
MTQFRALAKALFVKDMSEWVNYFEADREDPNHYTKPLKGVLFPEDSPRTEVDLIPVQVELDSAGRGMIILKGTMPNNLLCLVLVEVGGSVQRIYAHGAVEVLDVLDELPDVDALLDVLRPAQPTS